MEPRLLLTTLHGGDHFVYANTTGQMVRVDLVGDYTDAIELFTLDTYAAGTGFPDGRVIDLPGLLNPVSDDLGRTYLGSQISWPSYMPPSNIVDLAGGVATWTEFDYANLIRGARTEIYAIYIASASPTTVLSISTLASAQPQGANWEKNINKFASTSVPLLSFVQSGFSYFGPEFFTYTDSAPDGSGGAIVGARVFIDYTPDPPVIASESVPYTNYSQPVDPEGVYPGGDLNAGITVAAGIGYTWVTGVGEGGLGTNVHSVASYGSGGDAYAVDLSAFRGRIISSESGGIGASVAALAADLTGDMYTVDNIRGLVNYTGLSLGANVKAVASDGLGTFYYVDEATHTLRRTTLTGVPVTIGVLMDSVNATWRYDGVQAMDFDPISGDLYAIGTVTDTGAPPAPPDPIGPFLITIDTTTGVVTQGPLIHGTDVTVAPDTVISSIAFNPSGVLYAVVADTNLVTVDTASGLVTLVSPGATLNVTGIQGIDFIYTVGDTVGSLYGVTATGLYRINVSSAVATALATETLAGITALTYDAANPGCLFVTYLSGGAHYLARISLGASLQFINTDAGYPGYVATLVDDSEPTFVYRNITAMDFDGTGQLWAIGSVEDLDLGDAPTAPSLRFLLQIDIVTGAVTRGPYLSGVADLSGIAFDSSDTLYGVYSVNDNLYTIDTVTGGVTYVGDLPADGFVGIQFTTVASNEVFFGVTNREIYEIDPDTGDGVLLGGVAGNGLTCLAFDVDEYGVLWSAEPYRDGYALVRIPLSARLVQSDSAGVVTEMGLLIDSDNEALGYTGVHALAFDDSGTLWGVGYVTSMIPLEVSTPSPDGAFLIQIDTTTGIVTQVVATPLSVADLSTIAFQPSTGTLFGVDPDRNELVTVDTTTGAITRLFVLTVSGITGIDFDVTTEDLLYAVDSDTLYSIDLDARTVTTISPVGNLSGLTGLSAIPAMPDDLYATVEFDGVYYLIRLEDVGEETGLDMGRIIIGGTLAGSLINREGSLEVLELGYLWAKVDVAYNISAVILRQGGGGFWYTPEGLPAFLATPNMETRLYYSEFPEDDTYRYDPDSWIRAGGYIGQVDSLGGDMYTFVEALADPMVTPPREVVWELETGPVNATYYDWLSGYLTDYDNNSQDFAQYLSSSTGTFRVWGELVNEDSSFSFDTYKLTSSSDSDWYALPLLAGQSVTIDAYGISSWLYDENGNRIEPDELYPFTDSSMALNVYDSAGHMVDTVGFAALPDGTQKKLSFTARAADTYYLVVYAHHEWGGDYELDITDGTSAGLGAVTIHGNYDGTLRLDLPGYAFGDEPDTPDFAAHEGANIGAIKVFGTTYGAVTRTFQGGTTNGDIITYSGGTVGRVGDAVWEDIVASDGNVGRVASTAGVLNVEVYSGWTAGALNKDAFIQNISAAGDFENGIVSATGSIGVIEISGTVLNVEFHPNSDQNGPAGRVDLINVTGNWGSLGQGIPVLTHGPGGDIVFLRVAGTIYARIGAAIQEVKPTVWSDGRTSYLNDDSGGQLIVKPITRTITTVDPVTGLPVTTTYTPTYSYRYIGVDDDAYPGIGAGGVIANLTFSGTGNVELTTLGDTQMPDLDLSGLSADSTILINATYAGDKAEVYYVHTANRVASFTNTTGGLISGAFGAIGTLTLAGSLGSANGSTGAWLPGHDDAPAGGGTDEPQYGWFHGRINGIDVAGDLENAYIAGSVGDIRVTGGTLGNLRVNSDGVTPSNEWHGIVGLIWSDTRINYINVGDGLEDFGGADVARAAIMCTLSIGTVEVAGPWRARTNNVGYGEIHGAILAGGDDSYTYEIPDPADPTGVATITVTVYLDAIGRVAGTRGARLEAIVSAIDLDYFQVFKGTASTIRGVVGTVSFSGPGAIITNSDIEGHFVREVFTSADSDGINNTIIFADDPRTGANPLPNNYGIGKVTAGGIGLRKSDLSVNGGNVGPILGLGRDADIWQTRIVGTDSMASLSARNVFGNEIHMTGTVGTFTATGHMFDNIFIVGAIDSLTVAGEFVNNVVTVGGYINSMTIGGNFDSILTLQGPTTAILGSLTVNGNIAGAITSGGRIGKIVSKTGGISAEISTLGDSPRGDVDLIQCAGEFNGVLDIHGDLKKFVVGGSLGDNPATHHGVTQRMDVWGDLLNMQIGSSRAPADLFAELNVGGNAGTLVITGTLYGALTVNGNINQLTISGALGGLLDMDQDGAPETPRGSLYVLGTIKKLSIPAGKDLFADVTTGGSISGIALKGGSIIGDIESRFGALTSISVTGGDIEGNLTGRRIGKVAVTGGDIFGDITATNGPITSVAIKNGDLIADVTVQNGVLGSLSISGGDARGGHTIYASAGIGSIKITNGDLNADVLSRRNIGSIAVSGSDLTGNVWAETSIKQIKVSGNILYSTIRAGAAISSLAAGNIVDALISSARSLGKISVLGNVDNSLLLAGYDVGPDLILGGGDDVLHSGDLASLAVRGTMIDSVAAAGVGPGVDNDFLTTGNNALAGGLSYVKKVVVTGGPAGATGVLGETNVDPKFAALYPASVTAYTPTQTIFPGDPGTFWAGSPLIDGALTLTLTGLGVGLYNSGTGQLTFEGTTSKSKILIAYGGVGGPTLDITGNDDSSVGALQLTGGVTVDDMTVDGYIAKLLVGGPVAVGASWELPGGVGSAVLVDPPLLDVHAGAVGSWKMGDAYGAGAFAVDSIKSFDITGNFGGSLETGAASKILVRGDLTGSVSSWDTLSSLSVTGSLTGSVNVYVGDLLSVSVGGSLSGAVNNAQQVQADSGGHDVLYGGGQTKSVKIGAGDFGGKTTTSYRTSLGIRSFSVGTGGFSGVLSTLGDLGSLSVRGAMTGRAWSGGTIKKATIGSMNKGLLAASGDLVSAAVKGDMSWSWMFAGFDPGDAGYDAANGGEKANLMIDALLGSDLFPGTQADWNTVGNADEVLGGSIKTVTIGGTMARSTISAGVGPGADGYVGTNDDQVAGTGTVSLVKVAGDVLGTINDDESYGIFAASSLPRVIYRGTQIFVSNDNATVASMAGMAGSLAVDDVEIRPSSIIVYLNHPADSTTVGLDDFALIASVDSSFLTAGDNTNLAGKFDVTYSSINSAITLTLTAAPYWSDLDVGDYFRLTLADTISDIRGNILDGEFFRIFPTGDGVPGGAFVYPGVFEAPDTFEDAVDSRAIDLVLNGGTISLGSAFESISDYDVFRFTASAGNYVSLELVGDQAAEMGLFFRDTQGTSDTYDDTYELVARWEDKSLPTSKLFEAFELSETGEYFVAIVPVGETLDSRSYQLVATLSTTDDLLVAELGGSLPDGERIAYVNNVDNNPKQLVYLNFGGGTTNVQFEELPSSQTMPLRTAVEAFDLEEIDATLIGKESTLIYGNHDNPLLEVTGILENVVSIYSTIPATYDYPGFPGGTLTVRAIDVSDDADWAAYEAAGSGLWFTTVDPAARGLNPTTDFTTVFIGNADTRFFGPDDLFGIASTVDVANLSKGDNAIVASQMFARMATGETKTDRLNEYAKALADTIAHELGHTLGLRHQPTDRFNYLLRGWIYDDFGFIIGGVSPDDPDNNDSTDDDSNQGPALMAYKPDGVKISVLSELGTADLEYTEFPLGQIDTVDLIMKWLK